MPRIDALSMPQTIVIETEKEVTVVVEKEKEVEKIVKETVVVKEEVEKVVKETVVVKEEVEKVVKETVVVEKEVVKTEPVTLNFFNRGGASMLLGLLMAACGTLLAKDEQGRDIRVDYNAAILFDKGEIVDTYRKLHLVPFTENFPYRESLPGIYQWLKDADTHFWEEGSEYTVFEAGRVRFSTPICFEDTFGYLPAEFVQAGAEVFVNVTNDSWSPEPACAIQHQGEKLPPLPLAHLAGGVSGKAIDGDDPLYPRCDLRADQPGAGAEIDDRLVADELEQFVGDDGHAANARDARPKCGLGPRDGRRYWFGSLHHQILRRAAWW